MGMPKSIRDIDVRGKKVLIRVDFNVPIDKKGAISDDTRIRSALPTIQYVLQNKGSVILMSHFGRPKKKSDEFSLAPCAKRLSELLNQPVIMANDCIGDAVAAQAKALAPSQVLLLENVRFYPAEEKPELDPSFAQKLAALGDVYINDAFGCAHRAHSSTYSIAQFFPDHKGVGFLMEKEIEFLGSHLKTPKRPFFAIIGGAKVSSKIGVLKSLLGKVDALFIGGGMAFTFMKAQNIPIGTSIVEEEMLATAQELISLAKEKNVKLYLPLDIVAATSFENSAPYELFDAKHGIADGYQGMDIGPKTITLWSQELKRGKTILWNGPVGVFEFENFAKGTHAIAETLAHLPSAITIAGGGETVAAIQEAHLSDKFSHISTGGGASLEYIEQGELPGIEILAK